MPIQAKSVGCDERSDLVAISAANIIDHAEYSIWPLPSAIGGPSTYPSSRRKAKLLRLLAVWLGMLAVIPALSPINRALADGTADNTRTEDTITVIGIRPEPLDYFNHDYNYVDSAISASFSSSAYVRLPTASVPAGNKKADVPEKVTCKSLGGPPPPPVMAGNPVVLFNGNKIELEVDFVSDGEAALHLQRLYNHYWAGVGIFGKHWISNFDLKLTFGSTGFTYTNGVATGVDSCYPRPGGSTCSIGVKTSIYAHRPDGKITGYYLNSADGIFYGGKSKIVRQANGEFVLYGEADQTETYSPAGFISSAKNAQGIGWTYTYTNTTYPYRVTHTSGRYVEFTWTGNQLTAVRDPAGSSYSYSYTANQFGAGLHRLASSSQPGNPVTTTTYHYELANNAAALTGKSFNGVRFSTFSYGGGGGAVSQTTHNGFETWNFSYEDLNSLPGAEGIFITTYVNPLGKITKNIYSYGKIWKVSGSPSPNCPASAVETTYNATTGYPELVVDANGNSTAFTYDGKGQMLSQTEAYGTPLARVTQNEWDPIHSRLLSVTVVGVSKTSYAYTADNRIASITQTNLLASSPATSRTMTYTYTEHANGLLATVTEDGPQPGSGDAVTQSFNATGDLISVSNGLGHVTTYANHNGLGQPTRVTSPNGAVAEYEYDARGRVVVERSFPNGSPVEKRYTYGASGLLDAVTTSDGNTIFYHYDIARRLIREEITEPGGGYAVKRYTYNAMSQPTKVEVGRDN